MIRPLVLAAGLALPAFAQGATAQGLAGPYLAARIAGYSNDYTSAATYYDRLLRDAEPQDQVLENAVVIYSVLGDFERASAAADRLAARGAASQFALGAQLVSALTGNDLARADTLLDTEGGVGGALLDGLLRGWISAAEGDMPGATAEFTELAGRDGFGPFAWLHLAYARAMTGDFEGAQEILSGDAHGPLSLTTRGIAAHAQVLVELDRRDDAAELLGEANAVTNSPALQDLAERIEAGDDIGWDFVETAQEGMSEAYFTLAAILAPETSATFTLLNARAATALRPDHVDALVLVGELFESQERYDLAAAALTRVPRDDPSFFGAEITRAEVLLAAGRDEAAVEVLRGLTRSNPDRVSVWTAYADVLRRLERFVPAADAYDRAIALAGDDADWFLHYARGIAREREGEWEGAEADFREALDLSPGQPLVLNYLGYGLVERREKLDEALGMIEEAVAARPDDGYITDSLAWVYYRLGRIDDAVEPMERAVELRPLDALINDHLGDVLWSVGRKREAEFQWRRALSLEPEEQEDRIRRKLEVGLDVVLEEEGGAGEIEAARQD